MKEKSFVLGVVLGFAVGIITCVIQAYHFDVASKAQASQPVVDTTIAQDVLGAAPMAVLNGIQVNGSPR